MIRDTVHTSIEVRDGQMTIKSTQDCTPIAEYTKARHNEGHHGSSELRHAAKIPRIFVEDYCNRNNILFSEFMHNKDHIKRLVNDPAISHFRIWKGRI